MQQAVNFARVSKKQTELHCYEQLTCLGTVWLQLGRLVYYSILLRQQLKIHSNVLGMFRIFMIEQMLADRCVFSQRLQAHWRVKIVWESLSDLFNLSVQKNHSALACEWLCNSWECKIPSTSEGIHISSPGLSEYCWIYPEPWLWSAVPPCLWLSERSAEWDVHRLPHSQQRPAGQIEHFESSSDYKKISKSLPNSSTQPLVPLLKDIKYFLCDQSVN